MVRMVSPLQFQRRKFQYRLSLQFRENQYRTHKYQPNKVQHRRIHYRKILLRRFHPHRFQLHQIQPPRFHPQRLRPSNFRCRASQINRELLLLLFRMFRRQLQVSQVFSPRQFLQLHQLQVSSQHRRSQLHQPLSHPRLPQLLLLRHLR